MNEMEEQVISISEIFEALKKRWILIVSITLVATLISGILNFASFTSVETRMDSAVFWFASLKVR